MVGVNIFDENFWEKFSEDTVCLYNHTYYW